MKILLSEYHSISRGGFGAMLLNQTCEWVNLISLISFRVRNTTSFYHSHTTHSYEALCFFLSNTLVQLALWAVDDRVPGSLTPIYYKMNYSKFVIVFIINIRVDPN